MDPELTIVSVDGIGAFDLMRRRAMLSKLASLPRASAVPGRFGTVARKAVLSRHGSCIRILVLGRRRCRLDVVVAVVAP